MIRGLATFSLASSLSMFAIADNPVYLDILLGYATQTEELNTADGDVEGEQLSVGFRLGYKINDYFAVEGGIHDYGEANDRYQVVPGSFANDKIKTTSRNIGFKGTLPITDSVRLNARVGVFYWDYKFRSTVTGASVTGRDDGEDIYFGLGSLFNVTEGFVVGFEYTVMDHEATILGGRFDRQLRNAAFIIHSDF